MSKLFTSLLLLIGFIFIRTDIYASAFGGEVATVRIFKGSFNSHRVWSFDADPSATLDDWHRQRAVDLRDIRQQAHALGKQTNFAMFRLQMVLPRGNCITLFDSSADTVFASGGDKDFLQSLKTKLSAQGNRLNGKRFVCAADYWHPYPDQPADSDLRQNIAEILGFREALTSAEKDSIAETFKVRISGADYLEEMTLKPKVVTKLVNSCRASLSWRVFDDASNQLAHGLKLVDKTKKAKQDWHLNDLFGSAFQLHFADSEQAIRQFICSLDSRKFTPTPVTPFLDFSDAKFLSDIATYKTDYEANNKLKKELEKKPDDEKQRAVDAKDLELSQLSDRLDNHIVGVITQSGVKFRLEIASYYEMCSNCQATFQCEFLNMGIIQQKCMLLMTSSCHDMAPDLKWYVNGRLYQYGLAKKIEPLVSLYVSSQSEYAPAGDK